MSFYVLNNHLFNDDEYAINERIEPINRGDGDHCDLCGRPISLLKWLPPYNVRVTKKRLGDFIFGDVHPFLVSQKFKDLYESGGYNGIASFSRVQLFFRRQPLEVAYYFPQFLPYSRRLDLEKCGIKVDPAEICPRCQHGGERDYSKMVGIFWEDDDSIMEDVIKTKATSNFSFSQRLKDAMEAAGITNTVFVPAEKFVPSHVLALKR